MRVLTSVAGKYPGQPLVPINHSGGGKTVGFIPFYSGADGEYFRSAVEAGIFGLVVEGLAMGNVNQEYYEGIKEGQGSRLTVVLTTRCAHGLVIPFYGYPGGGASLNKLGGDLRWQPLKRQGLNFVNAYFGRGLRKRRISRHF